MYRYLILILVLISILSLTGCSAIAGNGAGEKTVQGIPNVVLHQAVPESTIKAESPFSTYAVAINAAEMGNDSSRGIGFRRPEEPDNYPLDTPQHAEFRLEENEPLSLYLMIPNGNQGPRSLLVTAILDYQQVSFEMDGQEGLLHAVTVPPNTHTNLPFKLKVPGAGSHDLQIICFDDPFNKTLDRDYWMNLRGNVSARRAVVIVGDNETPVQSLNSNLTGTSKPPEIAFGYTIYFASALETKEVHPSYRQLYVGQSQAGKPYSFQVVLNNQENEAVTYALIPFSDYHQIVINGQNILVWPSLPGEEAVIDAQIELSQEMGVHQFQMVYLYDPYQSVLSKEIYSPAVFGSPRLAIEVR